MQVFDIEKTLHEFGVLTEKVDFHGIQELVDIVARMVNMQRKILAEIMDEEVAGRIPAVEAEHVIRMIDLHAQQTMAIVLLVAKSYKALGMPTQFVAPKIMPVSIAPTRLLPEQKEATSWQN